MPDNDFVEINISRVIPAPKWRVIRLVTKIADFPSYIPAVKEAEVIQKAHRKMLTRWKVQADEVPISWVEEDTLVLDQDIIRFNAIKGDLQEFRGEWHFKELPEGTQVSVHAFLKVEIPMIQAFAKAYIQKMLSRTFEAILEAIERRLISTKYIGFKSGAAKKIAGFAIIGHFYNFNHLVKSFKMLNPDFKVPSQEFLGRLFNLSPSFKVQDILNFKSRTGQAVNGCFIGATFIPDMIEKDMWAIFSKVVRACKIAEKHGMGIVTLGGFTSIIGERIGQEITNEVDIPVTTGNTFTVAMAIDGVIKAARLLNLDISSVKAAVIGGTGDIGSACARELAPKVKQLTITGRTKSNLKNLSVELAKLRKARITATTDNAAAVRGADIVIAAAASSAAILDINWFKPGSIICDVGYPKNVSYTPTDRSDILIFSGGLAKSPSAVNFPIDMGLPSADTLYGCFCEAIILDLESRFESFSFGRGNITIEKVDEIRQLGKKHGFEVSDFYWGHKPVDAPMIEKIKASS